MRTAPDFAPGTIVRQVHVYVPEQMIASLEATRRRYRVSRSRVVRAAILAFLSALDTAEAAPHE